MSAATTEEHREYYYELGRFVSIYATVEGSIFVLMASLIGISLKDSNAVLSGAKTDQCISNIKRLYEARETEMPDALVLCLDQIGLINKLRNDILHSGTKADFTVTNELRALPDRIIAYPVSAKLLQNAIMDMGTILLVLASFISPEAFPTAKVDRTVLLSRPWRCKRPVPTSTHPESQTKTPKHKPPRGSSRAKVK